MAIDLYQCYYNYACVLKIKRELDQKEDVCIVFNDFAYACIVEESAYPYVAT